jgi:hypothetical protein
MRPSFHPLAAVAVLAWCAPLAAAPEFRAGYGHWRYALSGTVTDPNRTYDLQDDLALETSGRRSILVEWDTPAGWFPDLSASFAQLGASGYREETFVELDLLGNPLGTQTESIAAFAEFDDFDLTARYPFGLGPLALSAGVTVKRLRGSVLIDDSRQSEPSYQSYDETVPQLHAGLRWPLGRWLTLVAAAQGIRAGDSSALEWRGGAELRLGVVLLEGGYQVKRYDIDVGDYALDATVDGALLRAGLALR